MKKSILAAAMLLGVTSGVQAADLGVYVPEAARYTDAGFDWSGFYAGLAGGYGSGTARSVRLGGAVVDNFAVNGGLIGATVGLNAQMDQFVLGVEGDLLWSGINGSAICDANPGFTCSGSGDWLGSVRARAGVAFDQVLLYATGGLAIGGMNAKVTPAPAGMTGTFSDTFVGWTVGGGVEMAVTETLSVKAEYAYNDLGTRRSPAGTLGPLGNDNSVTIHTFKVGVNMHF